MKYSNISLGHLRSRLTKLLEIVFVLSLSLYTNYGYSQENDAAKPFEIRGDVRCLNAQNQMHPAQWVVVTVAPPNPSYYGAITNKNGEFQIETGGIHEFQKQLQLKFHTKCRTCNFDFGATYIDPKQTRQMDQFYAGKFEIRRKCEEVSMNSDEANKILSPLIKIRDSLNELSAFATNNLVEAGLLESVQIGLNNAGTVTYDVTRRVACGLFRICFDSRREAASDYFQNFTPFTNRLGQIDNYLTFLNMNPGFYNSSNNSSENMGFGNLAAISQNETRNYVTGFSNWNNFYSVATAVEITNDVYLSIGGAHLIQRDQMLVKESFGFPLDRPDGNVYADMKSKESIVNFGSSIKVNRDLSVGISARFNRQEMSIRSADSISIIRDIDSTFYDFLDFKMLEYSENSFDFNLSLAYRINGHVQVGVTANNLIGTNLVTSFNPIDGSTEIFNARFIGAGINISYPNWRVGLDVNHYNDELSYVGGVGITPFRHLNLKVGYSTFNKEFSYHLNYKSLFISYSRISDTIKKVSPYDEPRFDLQNLFGGINITF